MSPLRLFSRPLLLCAAGFLSLASLLAACDRHSATEVPESYGHGSGRAKTYDGSFAGHETDSRHPSHHFSDTQGGEDKEAKADSPPGPAPESTIKPSAGRLLPSGK